MKKFWLHSSRRKKALLITAIIVVTGFVLPENFAMPVTGAHKNDYNTGSFWYYPWGKSGTHKGVDIFAQEGTPVVAATGGMVLYSGEMGRGGNVIVVLGPKWRLHYYAHLEKQIASPLEFVGCGEKIGTVGTTGNAKGKSPHLHYSIATVLPYFWRIDGDHQGWKKMFYLDPTPKLNRTDKR
ncbi:MAG TPA: M23 family metallopeptidase [Bacteroidia bacterium]|nr:M23 family metallopeptidase [Bacteroidia bacterium]